jgi:membrane-bound serine protease (ClpP class)
VLVLGLLLTMMAILTPGTGIYEAGALILLILAGWEVYRLPINLWALGFLLIAGILFLLAFRRKMGYLFLGLSILTMVIGSVFLFRGESWNRPAVNPLLALVVSLLSSGFAWVATHKALEARHLTPAHSLDTLLGAIGEAKTEVHVEGSVQVAGELWSAHSHQPISAGSSVRVLGRDGFNLEVEPTSKQKAE